MAHKGALFSQDRRYRYTLWRTWSEGDGHVLFIGLNPSTADETQDDPTVRRCIGFAKEWGFGGIYMLNLFAFRATMPKDLKKAADPVGPHNLGYLKTYCDPAGMNVACWGSHGRFMGQGQRVIDIMGDHLQCFGLTKNGQPKHPLYLPKTATTNYMSLYKEVNNGS